MATIQIPPEFKELLNSLNAKEVEYLLIGGYAVVYYGYVRTTGDLDIWISLSSKNVVQTVAAIRALGFNIPWLKPELLLKPGSVLRIGVEPFRFEILNEIDGVTFDECFSRRLEAEIGGIKVNLISLQDLKTNKRAAGRHKDLADLEHLP